MSDVELDVHPVSGLHYIHVVPKNWGPYVDIYAMYEGLSRRVPWTTVAPVEHWSGLLATHCNDPRVFFVLWNEHSYVPSFDRRCTVTYVYSEALDPDRDKMLPQHRAHLERFVAQRDRLDAVFTHTPWMAEQLGPARVLPVGWCPRAMGTPRFSNERRHAVTTWGSRVGRRRAVFDYLQAELGVDLHDATGRFGRGLVGALEMSRIALYVAHSTVQSYSTWRLWQTLASGALFAGEPGDSWPFVPGQHFHQLPRVTLENLDQIAVELRDLVDTNECAYRAYRDLGTKFTVDAIVEDYLVPASIELRRGS